MRERLVELLLSKSCMTNECPDVSCEECECIAVHTGDAEKIADYLLANGVIVPPFKVGDKYVMDTAKTIFKAWNDVTGAVCEGISWYYELESVIEDIVKLSFGAGVLYREEAERALKGGEG